MLPLEIVLRLLTPVGYPLRRQPHPLHFDALLIAVLAAREKHRFNPEEKDVYAPGENNDVPLAVAGEKVPIYQASIGFYDGMPTYGRYSWIKKPPSLDIYHLENASRRNQKPSTFSQRGEPAGRHRAWLEDIRTAGITEVKFQCVGDKGMIEDLLADVRNIGVMRRAGLGEVYQVGVIPVKEAPEDYALIRRCHPARTLPVVDWPQGKDNWTKGFASIRAPYWYPDNREWCWLPPVRDTVPGL